MECPRQDSNLHDLASGPGQGMPLGQRSPAPKASAYANFATRACVVFQSGTADLSSRVRYCKQRIRGLLKTAAVQRNPRVTLPKIYASQARGEI